VQGAVVYGLVDENVPVADLNVEATSGISANPGLKVNGCALAPEIRKWYQVSDLAALAFRQSDVHSL
jgi:hypothetical protein